MKRATGLLLAFCALAALLGGCGGGEEEKAVTALAMNDDPEATVQAVLYLGDPEEHAFQLPQGEYLLLAMDADGNIADVHASLLSEGVVPLDNIVFGSSATKEERDVNEENMGKLVEFFAVNEYSVLSYMERMLRTEGELSDEDVAAQFDEIAQVQASLEGAIEALEYFSEGSSAGPASPLYVTEPTLSTLPAPTAGAVSVLWEWRKWTKTLKGGAEDAREKIEKGMAALPDDRHRQWLLNDIPAAKRREWGVPDNVSDFLKKLEDGDLDDAALRIHDSLCQASQDPSVDAIALSNYMNHAQKTKSRPIDLAHKHGKKMVEQGWKFNMAVWKEMIGAAEGGEKAKKFLQDAIDKAILVYDLLAKPGEKITKLSIMEILAEGLKDDLEEMGVPADEMQGVLGVLTDKLYDKLKAGDEELVEDIPTPSGEAVFSPPAPEASPTPVAAEPTATPTPTVAPPSTAPAAPTIEPTPEATAAPEETATPAPDTSWIEGYVQGVANQWLDKGYDGIDVAVAADDLRGCLTDDVVDWGLSKEEAIADCPTWLFEPSWTPEPTETPEPTPTLQPTEAATPEPQEVTAVGGYVQSDVPSYCTVEENTMTLTFSSGGGPVSGQGRAVASCEFRYNCPRDSFDATMDYEGNYYPDSKTFSGTWKQQEKGTTHSWDQDESRCVAHPYEESASGTWQATLEDGVVKGDEGPAGSRQFELTLQG